MRIFVALPISQKLRDVILKWQKSHKNLPVRRVKPENLHITLIPPWEEDDLESVKTKLANYSTCEVEQFEIVFEKIEYGPHGPDVPRLIWAEGKVPEAILNIKNQISKILDLPEDTRPFLLHLTLARFRPQDFGRFPIKNLYEKINWRDEIKSFVLMESRLLPEGVEYKILQEMKL